MVLHERDLNRFADRSRELWSDRTMSESNYKESRLRRCFGSCPFASSLSFFLTLIGTSVCCGCFYFSLPETIKQINDVFKTEYIDNDWIRIFGLAIIFVLATMGGFSLILLIVGFLATGATRDQVYTGFRSRLGGRIATGFFSIIVYGSLLIWLFTLLGLMVPCIGLYILKHRCKEVLDRPTTGNAAKPLLCLTPGTYGIPLPKHKPDAQVCEENFRDLCKLTQFSPLYAAALIGSFFAVLGLVHFLCCLVANYAHIKNGRKLNDYEDAIREEIEISKMNHGR